MNEKKFNSKLITTFPNLKEKFDKCTNWQEGINTGSIVVYEDVFLPYIIEQIINNNKK